MSRIFTATLLVLLVSLPLAPSASAGPGDGCSGRPADWATCQALQTGGTAVAFACAGVNAAVRLAIDLYNQYAGPLNPVWPTSDCWNP
jgi:hypothetical protein